MAAGKSSSSAAAAAAGDEKKKRKKKSESKEKSESKHVSKSKSKNRSDKPASSKRTSSRDKDTGKKSGSKSSRGKSDELFRRYDRARSGALSRQDFLQLLHDYSGPPLTDADANGGGVPLGLERSPANSEFEAGQLFERYDTDHTGALSLDGFHRFFANFRSQLAAFARDVGYSTAVAPAAARPTLTTISAPAPGSAGAGQPPVAALAPMPSAVRSPREASPSSGRDSEAAVSPVAPLPPPRATAARPTHAEAGGADGVERRKLVTEFQSVLWKLRRVLKDELLEQRARLLDMMTDLRAALTRQQKQRHRRQQHRGKQLRATSHTRWRHDQDAHSGDPGGMRRSSRLPPHWSDPHSRSYRGGSNDHDDGSIEDTSENQAVELYEAMEADVEQIDEIGEFVRRHSSMDQREAASSERVAGNLMHASDLYTRARHLAMKEYAAALPHSLLGDAGSDTSDGGNESERPGRAKQAPEQQLQHASESAAKSHEELALALRVKDQMIYELLRERAELRRQRAAAEAYVEELSAVSTAEMRKWARLTDEMQAEIERLRGGGADP